MDPSTAPTPLTIGSPIHFYAGPLAGKTVRAELLELQHADRGRKFVKQDRRPLDPPPIVELRLYEVFHNGTPQQVETPINGVDLPSLFPGLVCSLDLFPVSGPDIEAAARAPQDGTPGVWHRRRDTDDPNIVAYVAGYPIHESTRCTSALVGESFTHVAPVEGRLLFTFGDITSTIEGYFILRYRAFNIHSNLPGEPVPIIAECYGQPFRVYSTKDFPGLAASTNLTKLVNKWGVKTNVREFGRSRGKKTTSTVTEGDAEASGSSSTGGTKRKADATEWSE